jgi:Retroviral aspartyl protease
MCRLGWREVLTTIKGQFWPLTNDAISTPGVWMPMIQGVSVSNATAPNLPNIIQSKLVALVDTGADMCCIDETLANSLPTLTPIRQLPQRGATGARLSNLYYLQIIVPSDNVEGSTIFEVRCLSSPLKAQGFLCDLLLGEDVIQHFELHLNRLRNDWSLSSFE